MPNRGINMSRFSETKERIRKKIVNEMRCSDEYAISFVKEAIKLPHIKPGDYAYLIQALGHVAKANDMKSFVKYKDRDKEDLYKLLAHYSESTTANVFKIFEFFGIELDSDSEQTIKNHSIC